MKVEIKIYFRFPLCSASAFSEFSEFSEFSALKKVFRLLDSKPKSMFTQYPRA